MPTEAIPEDCSLAGELDKNIGSSSLVGILSFGELMKHNHGSQDTKKRVYLDLINKTN